MVKWKKEMGPKFRDRKRLVGPGIRVPPFSAVGGGHTAHRQNRIIRQVKVVVKPGNPDASRLDGINDGISNHRRISLIGRLVPETGLRDRAEGVSNIEGSTKLALPVLRVDVVVIVEIEFVGVEGDLRSDEKPRWWARTGDSTPRQVDR